MKKLLQITTILLIIFFTSCKKEMTYIEFEKNVLTEIFPSLVDSVCVDCRIMMNPPPMVGKDIFDKNGNYLKTDSLKKTKDEKLKYEKWKANINEIKRDTSKLIIAFAPELRKIRDNVKSEFENHFPKAKLDETKNGTETIYDFDFSKIKLNNKFKLKNLNEFPKERNAIWYTKYNFVFSGILNFTRIQFDQTKQFGVLDAGFGCGANGGKGYRIYIKKKNNKWIIDEIKGTWVT
jgi:hypothetical protein